MPARDSRRIKQQLENAQTELKAIKSSRTFKVIRTASHVKNQLKSSPIKFTKKTVRKIVSGTLLSKGRALNKNLLSISDIQTQYKNWIVLNEADKTELEDQRVMSDYFNKKPLISIVTPVYNPPADVFEELIQSVLSQTYSHFELCLWDDYGENETIIEIIKKHAEKDSRIKYFPFAGNKGIAGTSNRILAKVKGEYIALLDHDDTLSPDALFENVKLINEDDYDFIYSDKDKIDEQGNRFDPFFKPGWSPEVMLSANYLTHLNVMKTSVVKKVGGWNSATDGAQDWDLFLNVIAASKKVGHIQKVLYHWRVIATSTAMSIETKPYALEGQRRTVDEYLGKRNIPATSYHEGAELLLKWEPTKRQVVCVVKSHSNSHLRNFLADLFLNKFNEKIKFIILHSYEIDSAHIRERKNIEYVQYNTGEYYPALSTALPKQVSGYVLFFDDRLSFKFNESEIRNLTGWLDISDVVASSPRIIDNRGYASDCGAMITSEGLKPLFNESPPYHQAPLGNIEWVRDMALLSPLVFSVNTKEVVQAISKLSKLSLRDDQVHSALQLQLSKNGGRMVFNPKVLVNHLGNVEIDVPGQYGGINDLCELFGAQDPYMNRNLSQVDPMQITDIVHSEEEDYSPDIEYGYQLEARAHAAARTLSYEDIVRNSDTIQKEHLKKLEHIKSAIILLPDFYGIYAGLNNIFSYADYLHNRGVKVTFGLMTADTSFDRQRRLIAEKFPQLGRAAEIVAVSSDNIFSLPHADIAICTQWATAYLLALFNKTHRKCYFIQDKEASFYPKGTISALVENTYGLGFIGLANTPGLLEWYQKEYEGIGVVIKSNVDLSKYHAPTHLKISPKAPYKIFFYARPNEPRNAFELGVASLVKLKNAMGNNVEIFAAGAEWDTSEHGLEDVMTNLGKIAYDKLPAFYRSMDAGIMFMFSGHPGVVASELMASGCPVVVNEYRDLTWHDLYQNEKTCLVSIPTADEVARNTQRCLKDVDLRKTLIRGGLKKVEDFYAHYEESMDASYNYLIEEIS